LAERCGWISSTGQCLPLDGVWICDLIVGYYPGPEVAILDGDSGGPVYNYNPNGTLNVRGLINCQNTGDTHRWCYTPAIVLANLWGARPMMQ
jgi:hypothetical protein